MTTKETSLRRECRLLREQLKASQEAHADTIRKHEQLAKALSDLLDFVGDWKRDQELP